MSWLWFTHLFSDFTLTKHQHTTHLFPGSYLPLPAAHFQIWPVVWCFLLDGLSFALPLSVLAPRPIVRAFLGAGLAGWWLWRLGFSEEENALGQLKDVSPVGKRCGALWGVAAHCHSVHHTISQTAGAPRPWAALQPKYRYFSKPHYVYIFHNYVSARNQLNPAYTQNTDLVFPVPCFWGVASRCSLPSSERVESKHQGHLVLEPSST